MSYRLLALDFDGTVATHGQLPTPRVRAAIAAAQAQGIHVVLATGRPFASASKFTAALGLDTPVICFHGALVRETAAGQATLFVEPAPPGPMDDLIALAEARELELTLYNQEHVYASRVLRSAEFYDRWFGLPIRENPDLHAVRRQLQAEGRPVLKGLFIGEPDDNDRLIRDLSARFDGRLGIVRSHPLFVEALSLNVSKATAVAFLAARYRVRRDDVIAVGDSGNDVSMVQWAGLGVAMANATPDVLAVADWVAPPVQEDGVAAVIEKFVLAGGRGQGKSEG